MTQVILRYVLYVILMELTVGPQLDNGNRPLTGTARHDIHGAHLEPAFKQCFHVLKEISVYRLIDQTFDKNMMFEQIV